MAGWGNDKTRGKNEARLRADVIDGYRRLAFGSNRDTLGLMFRDEPPGPEALAKLDIFNVSAIKRDKNGALEIKFYDRCDALEHLEAFCAAADSMEGVKAFYDAISRSVEAGRETEEH
ncbi:MAG: hypothetical protein FWF60_07790 [Oscillospiraceae bacterium]|nr:hypothetical protein [Oscillospiraceae bacterium]MCL1952714.1 hypothetical protein [Oscillospiraceae bacterium]